jgi:hypothetical protein
MDTGRDPFFQSRRSGNREKEIITSLLTKKPVHLAKRFAQADRFKPSQAENIRFIQMPSMRIDWVSVSANEEKITLVGFFPKCLIFKN